jgi:hypothetical protein
LKDSRKHRLLHARKSPFAIQLSRSDHTFPSSCGGSTSDVFKAISSPPTTITTPICDLRRSLIRQ